MLCASQLRSWPCAGYTVSRHLASPFHKVMGRNGIERASEEKNEAAKRDDGITHLSTQHLMSGVLSFPLMQEITLERFKLMRIQELVFPILY